MGVLDDGYDSLNPLNLNNKPSTPYSQTKVTDAPI